jgi:predicted anti-sigma-YlaC factor YlaD
MDAERCPQHNLIAACHDGRLGAADQASCERHLRTCHQCRAFADQLATIREAIRAPVADLEPLAHQRARLALLRAAAGPPQRQPRARWLAAAASLFAVSALAGMTVWQGMARKPPIPPPQAVREVAPAEGPTAVPVGKARVWGGPQALPAAATPVTNLPAEAAPAIAPAVPLVQTPEAVALPAHPKRPANGFHGGAARSRPTQPSPVPVVGSVPTTPPAVAESGPDVAPEVAPPEVTPASRDFAAAMDAMGSGDFGLAARRFAEFAAAYPRDPRSDDAAYLVAIALQRAGRAEGARAAAARYLQVYPQGAHRLQAEKLSALGRTVPE